jgi:hypothetical protein
MADELPDPISRELSVAFLGAIGRYRDWCRGEPEPEVTFAQRDVSISLVRVLVMGFKDPMPDSFWDLLLAPEAGGHDDSIEDRSYDSGARYLAKLISERREHFSRPYPDSL